MQGWDLLRPLTGQRLKDGGILISFPAYPYFCG